MSKDSPSRVEQIEKLGELIHEIDMTMMTTAMPDGSLRSRPMSTQKTEFNGSLWFFTGIDSAKIHEIEDDKHVNLSYSDPNSQTYISVSGRAKISQDKARIHELWSPELKAWFPDGKDDPQIALIEVVVDNAEYWDAPSNAMIHLVGMVKSVTTGQSYEPGENEKISF